MSITDCSRWLILCHDRIWHPSFVFQHGPPHLVNLVCSSPPPQGVPPPISQSLMQHLSAQLMHPPPHSVIHVTHVSPEEGQFAHLGPHTILQTQQILPPPADGQQMLAAPPGHPYLPPPHQGLPPHLLGPPPLGPTHSPSQHMVSRSPGVDNRYLNYCDWIWAEMHCIPPSLIIGGQIIVVLKK